MGSWLAKLVNDKDGNPNEHIIAGIFGTIGLWILAYVLLYAGHAPSLTEFGIAHGSIWTATGAGSFLARERD